LKRGGQTKSSLEDIAGIGPVTRKQLIKKFGSLRGVSQADPSEITALIGAKKAQLVIQSLQLPTA
jgi:excinuclease UvrABC nuclease subunit